MIRLGLIGCGNMGSAHRRGLEQLKGRAKVVATVDLCESLAQSTAEALGAEMATTEYRRIFERIDAAIVVLPHHLHYPVGLDLLEAGKHLLMEKPLANSEAQCLDLIRAAEARSLTFMVAYCMRFHPLLEELERLIRDKVYGELFQLSIWTEQHTQREPGSWMHRVATLGGGQLFSHGCHYIDILLAWLGEPLEGTHMGGNHCTPWMEAEGTSNVSMRFASGALGYHFGTWGAKGSRLRYSFHAHCQEAMIEAQVTHGKLILHRGAQEDGPAREELLMEAESGKQTEREIIHFIECVESGAIPRTDARSSLQSLRVIWKLYEAEREGRIADLRGLGMSAVSRGAQSQ